MSTHRPRASGYVEIYSIICSFYVINAQYWSRRSLLALGAAGRVFLDLDPKSEDIEDIFWGELKTANVIMRNAFEVMTVTYIIIVIT